MSPAEAGLIDLEEPDWRQRFEEHLACWPRLERFLAQDEAFESTLKDWRRFHSKGKIDGIIALAELKIFPPRFTIKNMPRDGVCGYQHDDHCWFGSEQWRISGVDSNMLCLERDGEMKQINLTKAKWDKYIEGAVAVLNAMQPLDND